MCQCDPADSELPSLRPQRSRLGWVGAAAGRSGGKKPEGGISPLLRNRPSPLCWDLLLALDYSVLEFARRTSRSGRLFAPVSEPLGARPHLVAHKDRARRSPGRATSVGDPGI